VKRKTSGFSSEQPSVFSIVETFALISVSCESSEPAERAAA